MKNKNKWIGGGLVAIVLIVAILFGTNSELFKGQFVVPSISTAFQLTKRNCALAAKWAAEGTYTANVRKRGWPYKDDLNGDGIREEFVVASLCTDAGFPMLLN